MRTRDLEAWKKELEFWSNNENGKHDLNVAFESIEFINVAQLVVILLLNPVSKGVGKLATEVVVAATMPLDDVVVGASVDDDPVLVEIFSAEEDDDEDEGLEVRRRRSAAPNSQSFFRSGGGL